MSIKSALHILSAHLARTIADITARLHNAPPVCWNKWGLLFTACWLLIAACSGCGDTPASEPDTAPTSQALSTSAPEPTATRQAPQPSDDNVVVALAGDPAGFNPQLTVSPISFEITRNIYDTLVRIDTLGDIAPGLAESWEVNDDGTVWTFHIKEGFRFSNGKTLRMQDIAYSIENLIDPATGSQKAEDYAFVDSVTISDTQTVNIHLRQPRGTLPFDLANDWAAIIPEEKAGQLYTYPIGTGPFQLVEWERGNYIKLQRSTVQAGSVEPVVDTVVFEIIPDEQDRVEAIRQGRVDIVTGLSISSSLQLQEEPGLVLARMPHADVKVLAFNHARHPFDDVRVREAFCHGIDRQALIAAVWPGAAAPAYGEFSPRDPFYLDLTGYFAYDTTRARALLAEAGYEQGIDTTIKIPFDEEYLRLADELARQLGEIGVRLQIQHVDWAIFLNEVFFGRDFDLTVMVHKGKLDPLEALSRYTSDSSWNYVNHRNPAYDELCQAATQVSETELRSTVAELQYALAEDALVVYLASPFTTTAMSNKLKNCQFLPDGSCDLRVIRKER